MSFHQIHLRLCLPSTSYLASGGNNDDENEGSEEELQTESEEEEVPQQHEKPVDIIQLGTIYFYSIQGFASLCFNDDGEINESDNSDRPGVDLLNFLTRPTTYTYFIEGISRSSQLQESSKRRFINEILPYMEFRFRRLSSNNDTQIEGTNNDDNVSTRSFGVIFWVHPPSRAHLCIITRATDRFGIIVLRSANRGFGNFTPTLYSDFYVDIRNEVISDLAKCELRSKHGSEI